MAAFAKYVDSALRKVLAVTLDGSSADPAAQPPVVHLAGLAQELQAEAGGAGCESPPLLNKETAERALMARLSEPPASYPQWPVHYLIGVYGRAAAEARSLSMLKEPAQQAALGEALALCRQLAVSYAGLTLTLDMFPQPPEASQRGALQLLDSLDAAASSSSSLGLAGPGPSGSSGGGAPGGAMPLPPGCLEDFAVRFADEGLPDLLAPIVTQLMQRAAGVSLLGDYSAPLGILQRMAACKPMAVALTQLPAWMPQWQDGRGFEASSVLGPFFGIGALADRARVGVPSVRQPDVAQQCFADAEKRRQGDINQAMVSLQMGQQALAGQLHAIVMSLLRNTDTREAMLNWLAAALDSNLERTKMRPDPKKMSTDGFALNLALVLLRCCDPFVDPASGKAWGKLDVRYACDPAARLKHSPDDTRLAATSEEVAAWFAEAGPPADGKYHFICECFFMAARALQLGVVQCLEARQDLARWLRNYQEDIEVLEGNPAAALQLLNMKRIAAWLQPAVYCYDAVLQDQKLLADALAFYRLSMAWQLRLASPSAAAGGAPTLPLPEPPCKEMCMLPEYFVEDPAELLLWVGRTRPDLVEPRKMEEFMVFCTVFLGSPHYVKNAYLRGKMVEALQVYMPPDGTEAGRRRRVAASAAEVAMLFEVHPLVIQSLIGSLLALYRDIEITDRHNTFYEKFSTRYQIGEILCYLWNLPQHRTAWRTLAQREPKLNVQFIHVMLNDSQHLLQDALELLPKVQETERLQADEAAWAALPQQDRQDREQALHRAEGQLQSDFGLASVVIRLMQLTAEDAAVGAAYFDAAVRNRTAKIVDFFLKYLTVPAERKRLRVKDPEKYNWHPKRLITELAQIHLALYRVRRAEWVQAVAADTDYLGRVPQLFTELVSVLRALGLLSPDDIAALEALAIEVEQYKASVQEEEEAFEDIPEEYEDPLLGGLMRDPVQLPSGNIVERSSIVQQLLTDPRDPYSRAKCTEEDLVPLPDLKRRIDAWAAEQRSKRRMSVD
ncbi:putative ubiquitin conjugation factor E4 [Chlorella sorokiniana]|uniref:RING-type E3 ubiquitin transferase n=1 Tax=Chlorella sorokiniana TaxID=3076 RepID=A0A2P6TBF6_CHLSO|nr:putative ubiquitin conjugation factor E4 [Chlorella sorokiniana]|eukprot:PRW05883.1 putative ubiquitin conjugation factor E4 [Chlorella sorokiniana]